jgi:hypothetical protein
MIYDHVYGPFTDETSAMNFMLKNKINYRGVPAASVDEEGNWHWNQGHPVEIVIKEAVWDYSRREPIEISPRETLKGFFVRVPSDEKPCKHKECLEVVQRPHVMEFNSRMSVVAA